MICLLGNDHFNIPTRFLTTTLNLHIFIDVIKLNQTFIFQRYTTHFLRKAQILCFFLVIFIWLGHSFSFSTRISIYITASNIEMFVNLTFDRKYEKSTQKECMWTCLHYKMSFIIILSQRLGCFKANKYRLFQHKEWRLSHCQHFYVTQWSL